MSAKEAAGSFLIKALIVGMILFLVAAWQTGMLADLWNSITSKVPSVDVNTK